MTGCIYNRLVQFYFSLNLNADLLGRLFISFCLIMGISFRCSRLFGLEKRLLIVSMPLTPLSLDPKFCYLIDGHSELFLWLGSESRLMVRTKGRLLAEKISVRERRGEASIHLEPQGRESNTFWAVITGAWTPRPLPNLVNVSESENGSGNAAGQSSATVSSQVDSSHPPPPQVTPPQNVPRDFIPVSWRLPQPILYDVRMGKGYLELPQVRFFVNCSCFPIHYLLQQMFSSVQFRCSKDILSILVSHSAKFSD